MKIHIVTDRFMVGGGIEHIYQVVKGLEEFQFGVFGEPGNAVDRFDDLDNVTVYPEGYHPGYVLADRPDIVHIHHLKPLFTFFKSPFSRYEVPVIFTAHGLHIHKYEFFGTIASKVKYALRFFLEKRITKKAGKIIAVSREDREFLEKKYRLNNVVYLTNGIDFEKIRGISASKEELRKELQLPRDHFLCVTIARFNYQKGYDILIEAIARLKKTVNLEEAKIRFLFVGNGPEFEKMKTMSRELSITEYVSFLGERKDVYRIVKAADLFVLTSRWEGLPIVLLETGLLQTPVLASGTYGNREILQDGRGILFENENCDELAEKLGAVIEGKYDLPRYARSLYQEVESNYNLEKMLNGLREIYKSRIQNSEFSRKT